MKWLIFTALFISIFSFFASAQQNCMAFDSNSTLDLIADIPSISSQLSSCNLILPEQLSILNNKNILITIELNSGSNQTFYISFLDNSISALALGQPAVYSYNIILSENTGDNILQSENIIDTLLLELENKNVVVDPQGFWATTVWFFANLFF